MDKIFILSTTVAFFMSFNVYSQPFRALPIGFNADHLQLPDLNHEPVPAIAVLGIAGNPLPVVPPVVIPQQEPVPPVYDPNQWIHDSNSLYQLFGIDDLLLGPMIELDAAAWNQWMTAANVVVGMQIGNNNNYGSGPRKRSSTATSCSQIMFRGIDYTKFSGTIFWYA